MFNNNFLNHENVSWRANTVTAKFKEIKVKNKYIEEDLKIPILQGIPNATIQNNINNSIQGDIMEFKNQMEEAAREYGSEAEKLGKKFVPYKISNNYTITYNRNNILSLSVIYYEFISGRSYYIRATYNFNINTGKSLGLEDLFKPGVSYKELINSEIRKQLIMNKEKYPPDAVKNFKGIKEDQPFYLEDNNIVLFFGFHEIAPTVSEIPVIKIPFSTFKDKLKLMF
ncbi:DUF3298 and DUF4163 domain-containing protein [Clostridium sp. DJ247]|nr:DUF3298 and DUF4163 domain-containing protein [Clostridium sp. DJ247]